MEKVESEKGDRSKIEYAERRISGVLELRGYKALINSLVNLDIQRAIVIPLPPDFEFPANITTYKPNGIVVVEMGMRKKHKGKKKWRIEWVFRRKGYSHVNIISIKNGSRFGPENSVWISKEKYYEISKRDLYIDKNYIDKLFTK